MKFDRLFAGDKDPYQTVEYTTFPVTVTNINGDVLFHHPNGVFPSTWSDVAKKIVATKYFRASRIDSYQETSVRQMLERVVGTLKAWGLEQAYFDEEHANNFADELRMILLHQMASFNSPVWFNMGVPGNDHPLCSACFINSVDDSMSSILGLATTEGLIFKEGAGSGVNFSKLRASTEAIRGGGNASGPVSFMQGYDAFADVILSGGRTRRAARMCILNADHPDIEKFINCKVKQEAIVERLVQSGLSSDFNAREGAYATARHQTGNNSVRATNEFMHAAHQGLFYSADQEWKLINRTDGSVARSVKARDLIDCIAKAAHACGDPGMQFHDHINRMHTCANDGEINSSNPCGEYVWLDDSACNLSAINLGKFINAPKNEKDDREFDHKKFSHVVRVMITAQDIIVGKAHYPTEKIRENSLKYRTLGLGYANLGGLLMSWGLPYDSQPARDLTASITSLMTAQAYLTSAELAQTVGAFERFDANRVPMDDVLTKHASATTKLTKDIAGIQHIAAQRWKDAFALGFGKRSRDKTTTEGVGFRNAQTTLLQPTGTIAFMMDCATTGVEPDFGLKKFKSLVGGGSIEYINPLVPQALRALGYDTSTIDELVTYAEKHGHLEGSILKSEHLAVFDCSMTAGTRSIAIDGHIGMVAAAQPFVSGAISKTFNMPHEATVSEVRNVFLQAWEKGVKAITVYRQGSKLNEPMRVREAIAKVQVEHKLQRKILPDEVPSVRHHFEVAGHKGYLHIGLDPATQQPMEVFIRMARFGSTIGGLLDSYATLLSKALQFGLPLEELLSHMDGSKFPPQGLTSNPAIRTAGSLMDYIARYMKIRFLHEAVHEHDNSYENGVSNIPEIDDAIPDLGTDICPECGHPMVKTGATCYACRNCSNQTGVCS